MSKSLGRRAYVPKILPAISFVLVISLNRRSPNTESAHLLCALYPVRKPTGQEGQKALLLCYTISGLAWTCRSQRGCPWENGPLDTSRRCQMMSSQLRSAPCPCLRSLRKEKIRWIVLELHTAVDPIHLTGV